MNIEISLFDFKPSVRKIPLPDPIMPSGSAGPISMATFGPGSYLVQGLFQAGHWNAHILIGRYSSLADDLRFVIGMNHDITRVSNYPFLDLHYNEGTCHCYEANHYQIIIGNDVWIGRGVTILGGVRVGNGAVIGAGTVLAKDVPPYAVVVGNPARIVKYRFSKEIIDKLQAIKWWNWDDSKIKENCKMMQDISSFIQAESPHVSAAHKDIEEELMHLRNKGYKLYAFVADFDTECSIWEHVVTQYLKQSISEKNSLLLFATENHSLNSKYVTKLEMILENTPRDCRERVVFLGDVTSVLPEFVRGVDTFITTREDISSRCVDYASGYPVKIVYGLDYNIFRKDEAL